MLTRISQQLKVLAQVHCAHSTHTQKLTWLPRASCCLAAAPRCCCFSGPGPLWLPCSAGLPPEAGSPLLPSSCSSFHSGQSVQARAPAGQGPSGEPEEPSNTRSVPQISSSKPKEPQQGISTAASAPGRGPCPAAALIAPWSCKCFLVTTGVPQARLGY